MTKEERENNKQVWHLKINSFNSSDLTQEQWCEQQGIKLSSLRYWLKKFKSEEAYEDAPAWLKVNVSEDNSTALIALPKEQAGNDTRHISIRKGELTLDVPLGIPRNQLIDFIQVMRQS